MMNENNEVFSMEDEPVATAIQNMLKGSKWLSAFLESYRPPLDGEHYLTDREVAEMLRVSRRTLQEYRNNRMLPFILLAGKVLYPESGLRELLEANYLKPLEYGGCMKKMDTDSTRWCCPFPFSLSVCVFSNIRFSRSV